jgi:hypothetical protein
VTGWADTRDLAGASAERVLDVADRILERLDAADATTGAVTDHLPVSQAA